jgi:hypothetical protein
VSGEVTVLCPFEGEPTYGIASLSLRQSALAAIRDCNCSVLNSLGNGFMMDVIDGRTPTRRIRLKKAAFREKLGDEQSGFLNDICRD